MNDRPMTRRDFFKTSAWASALFAATPFWANGLDEPMPMEYMAAVPSTMPLAWTTPADLANTDPAVLTLNRIAFGPRAGDVERVRAMGADAFIEQQLAPETIDDTVVTEMLKPFPSLTMDIPSLAKYYVVPFVNPKFLPKGSANSSAKSGTLNPTMGGMGMQAITVESNAQSILELIQATILRQVYSERQLFEMMVDFWSNHFNIYALKKQCRVLKTWDDRTVIRAHALGKFRDLLFATASSPAMLIFLDNISNIKGVPQENYARELMELHTVGVDAGYTQADVQDVARAFTGWSMVAPGLLPLRTEDGSTVGAFKFYPNRHDNGPKTIWGLNLAPNGGITDAEQVLDLLANHPKTAQHISYKLVQRFVDDNPPAALVASAANTFAKTDGDLRAVMSTILHSDEFKTSFGKKVKRPLEFVGSALRALGAEPTNARLPQVSLNGPAAGFSHPKVTTRVAVAAVLRVLGQVPFLWASPNGYPDVAGAWVNSNNLLGRWNLALALANDGLVEFEIAPGMSSSAQDVPGMVDEWTNRILHRALPEADSAKLIEYAQGDSSRTRVANLVALLIASPHFQYR